jgi:hypothetical protein
MLLDTLEIAELELGVACTCYAADDDGIPRAKMIARYLGEGWRGTRRGRNRDGAVRGSRAGCTAGREAGGEGHY